MASRGKGARAKGFAFERDVAKKLTELVDGKAEFKRGLGQTRGGGSEVADVISDAFPDVHIECKRQIKCSIKGAVTQSENDKSEDQIGIVVTKDDRKPILVTMTWDDWAEMALPWLERKLEG